MGSETKELMVYEQIKADLLAHKYEPGFPMAERYVSEKYNMSRSPVRCALRLLVKDGLLKTDVSGRIVVPSYSIEDILEIYDLIEILQDYAVKILIRQPDADVAERLRTILENMTENEKNGKLKERMAYDDEFHFCIVNAANNSRLSEIFSNLMNQKKMFDFNSFEDTEHAGITTDQHMAIYEAIKKRELSEILAAIKEHEQYIKKYYVELLVLNKHNFTI